MIKARNLEKKYGSFKALDKLSFQIKKGEIVGFLGPNGAGKTTTMKILTCFMPPSSGDVKVDGYDTVDNDLEVRRRIGYLPESAPLYVDMEVRDYLSFIAGMRNINRRDIKSKYDRVVEICGLSEKVKMPIGTLSKGYKQRVGLAQAMIHEPKILILDEPTSGLDPHQIVEIRTLIKEIGKLNTVLLSTHILPEVSATCDRVIIINRGKIVAEGQPEELIASAKVDEVVNVLIEGAQKSVLSSLTKSKKFDSVDWVKEEGKNLNLYRIKSDSKTKTDLRKTVFDEVVKNKFSIHEMNMQTKSLEDVFLNLTKEE